VEGNTDFIVGLLLDQRIELGLVEGPCQRREIQVRPFLEDEIIWISSPGDVLAGRKELAIKTLLERPIISREIGSGTRRVVETAFKQRGIPLTKIRIVQELPSTEAIKRMVAAGIGIGYVSRLAVELELSSGKLVELDCPKLRIKRPFSILTPQGPDPIGIVQAFSRFLIETALRTGRTPNKPKVGNNRLLDASE
jgi:DNA-binding transcriptional LysR family regulator